MSPEPEPPTIPAVADALYRAELRALRRRNKQLQQALEEIQRGDTHRNPRIIASEGLARA